MITEDPLEQLAIQWLRDTGWTHVHGSVIAPEGVAAEREDFRAVVLKGRLASRRRDAMPGRVSHGVTKSVHRIGRPFRAWNRAVEGTQGVALGCRMVPLWGGKMRMADLPAIGPNSCRAGRSGNGTTRPLDIPAFIPHSPAMKNLAEQLSESCSEPIRMTDPEQVLDYLEQQIPGLSAAAVDVAYWQALASGQAVLVSGEGGIFQVFPDGTRKLVKTLAKPLSVPVGTRVMISGS